MNLEASTCSLQQAYPWLIIGLIGLVILAVLLRRHLVGAKGAAGKAQQAALRRKSPLAGEIDLINDLTGACQIYQTISAELGPTFPLTPLYRLSERAQLPHPYLTIRSLREAGLLLPQGDGLFSWKAD
jgi:hypothetical protein